MEAVGVLRSTKRDALDYINGEGGLWVLNFFLGIGLWMTSWGGWVVGRTVFFWGGWIGQWMAGFGGTGSQGDGIGSCQC